MGRPKLLLPLGGRTVIGRLLDALHHPSVAARVVVMRRDDLALREEVVRCGGLPVSPEVDPPEMRTSVEFGLQTIADRFHPQPGDGWLMLPGDHPVLDAAVLDGLLERWTNDRPRFLIPTCNGRRGHPLLARWDTVPMIRALPPDVGLNQLLRGAAEDLVEVPVASPGVLTDLDSPDDYERLRQQFAGDQ